MTHTDTSRANQPPRWLIGILNSDLRTGEDGSPIDVEIRGVRLVRTCYACPQQYDAFIGTSQVGYLRLRHGRFTVECPDVGGILVYSAMPMGDGIFADHEEAFFLAQAVDAILSHLNKS